MAVRKLRNKRSAATGLGFIDLLAITLVVVILQMTVIINVGDSGVPPQPVAYNVNVYQPAERPNSSVDHLGFVMIEGHLLLWGREPIGTSGSHDGLQRDYYDQASGHWTIRPNWGNSVPLASVFYTSESREKSIADFIKVVRENLGIDITIDEISGFPPRINIFFMEAIKPFRMEVGFHRCDWNDREKAPLYDSRYIHPILVKWVRLSQETLQGDSIFEVSLSNVSDWSNGRQFTLSPSNDIKKQVEEGRARSPGGSSCNGHMLADCIINALQGNTFISVTVEFDGSGLRIIDGHGRDFIAR